MCRGCNPILAFLAAQKSMLELIPRKCRVRLSTLLSFRISSGLLHCASFFLSAQNLIQVPRRQDRPCLMGHSEVLLRPPLCLESAAFDRERFRVLPFALRRAPSCGARLLHMAITLYDLVTAKGTGPFFSSNCFPARLSLLAKGVTFQTEEVDFGDLRFTWTPELGVEQVTGALAPGRRAVHGSWRRKGFN